MRKPRSDAADFDKRYLEKLDELRSLFPGQRRVVPPGSRVDDAPLFDPATEQRDPIFDELDRCIAEEETELRQRAARRSPVNQDMRDRMRAALAEGAPPPPPAARPRRRKPRAPRQGARRSPGQPAVVQCIDGQWHADGEPYPGLCVALKKALEVADCGPQYQPESNEGRDPKALAAGQGGAR